MYFFQVFIPGDDCVNFTNNATAMDDLNLYSVPVGMLGLHYEMFILISLFLYRNALT